MPITEQEHNLRLTTESASSKRPEHFCCSAPMRIDTLGNLTNVATPD